MNSTSMCIWLPSTVVITFLEVCVPRLWVQNALAALPAGCVTGERLLNLDVPQYPRL